MKSIDVKSLIIGILGTALVMVLMGVNHNNSKYQITCNANSVVSGAGNCLLLNTQSGIVKYLDVLREFDLQVYIAGSKPGF